MRQVLRERDEERRWAQGEVQRLVSTGAAQREQASEDAGRAAHEVRLLHAEDVRLRGELAHTKESLREARITHASEVRGLNAALGEKSKQCETLQAEVARSAEELERGRAQLKGKIERLRLEKAGLEGEMQARLDGLQAEKEAEAARLAQSLLRAQAEKAEVQADMKTKLQALERAKSDGANALGQKIKRLQQQQETALKAGSSRSRANLYADSLLNRGEGGAAKPVDPQE